MVQFEIKRSQKCSCGNTRNLCKILSGYSFSGTPSTNHEWYNNNYEHNHSANPPTLDDTQLMWCNGGFKWFCGISGTPYTKDTNKLNPYIDYRIYYDNNIAGKNYESQGTRGESWNYDNNWATANFGEPYYTGQQIGL